MFAAKSRTYGSKAEQHFKKANYHLESKTPESTSEAYLERLMLAMGELSKGLIEIRNQNGANTSLPLTSILLSQKRQ